MTFSSFFLLGASLTCILLAAPAHGGDTAPYSIISSKAEVYSLPPLTFGYDSLEPYIDEATLHAHHEGHHEAYRKKMNAALQQWRQSDPQDNFSTEPIVNILRNLARVPEEFRKAITNNGGGYVNHAIYWGCMSPNLEKKERRPTGQLVRDIEAAFGSFETFKEKFTEKATTLFGSGYVWLSRQPASVGGALTLTTTANQDSPISQGLNPILVLDVWEHAYYLKHQFRRPQHVADWWNIVDWENVAALDKWWTGGHGEGHRDEL